MSDDSHPNSAVNAAATTNIHHANLQDLPLTAARRLYKGGIRPGEPIRTTTQAQQMLEKIPPSARAGVALFHHSSQRIIDPWKRSLVE